MSGGKGGSTTSQVQIPKWMENAAKKNLARADDVAEIGYTPYYGPDVAATTPMQAAAFGNTNQAADAFGMQSVSPQNYGLPQAQTYEGGISGYSSGGAFDQALGLLEQNRPGQYEAIGNMFIDPQTGAPPVNDYSKVTEEETSAAKSLLGLLGGALTPTQIAQSDNDRDYNTHNSSSISQQSVNNAKMGAGGLY